MTFNLKSRITPGITLVILLLLFKSASSNLVNLTFDSDSYETHIGSEFTLTCNARNMGRIDVVWMIYLIENSNIVKAIYSDKKYIGAAATKYMVKIAEHENNTLTTSLTIYNVTKEDLLYAYKCECNIYKRCSNTNRAKANTTIKQIPFAAKYFANLSGTSYNDSINPIVFNYCNEGAINTAQYFLIVISALLTAAGTFLLYFSNERSQNEKYVLIFGMIVAGLSLLVSLIIWVNAQFFGKNTYISILIICFSLFACMIIWILDIIYLYTFDLVKGIKIIIYVLYIFLLATFVLLITTNAYCTGQSTSPLIEEFDYSYLELIGSCFLLLFSLFVSLAYGTIFYTLQEQKINEKINLTRLFKINRNFVFPSKSNGSDINITSLSAKNSMNFETMDGEKHGEKRIISDPSASTNNKIDNKHAPMNNNNNIRSISEQLQKHHRIKSESNLLTKNKTELIDDYNRLESDYLKTLQMNYTKKAQKSCFPIVSSGASKKMTNPENFEAICCNTRINDTMNNSSLENNFNETNISMLYDSINIPLSPTSHKTNTTKNSRTSVRPSSKLSVGNFQESYLFFKKPLTKIKNGSKTKKKTKKTVTSPAKSASPAKRK